MTETLSGLTIQQIWLLLTGAFFLGLILGFLILKLAKGNVHKQIEIEKELKATKAKVEEQKAQLEKHFEQSATLLATLAEDYKKLYTHLAQGSETLLPEANQTEFFKLAYQNPQDDDQPRDYSEGSSGLFKS